MLQVTAEWSTKRSHILKCLETLVALDPKGLACPWKGTQTYRKAPNSRTALLYQTLRQDCISIPWVNFLLLFCNDWCITWFKNLIHCRTSYWALPPMQQCSVTKCLQGLWLFHTLHKKTFVQEIGIFSLNSNKSALSVSVVSGSYMSCSYAKFVLNVQCGSLPASPVTKIFLINKVVCE
jgi:hypothetical protein